MESCVKPNRGAENQPLDRETLWADLHSERYWERELAAYESCKFVDEEVMVLLRRLHDEDPVASVRLAAQRALRFIEAP